MKIGTWNKKYTRHAAVLERSFGEFKNEILQLSHRGTGCSQTPSGSEATDGNILLGLCAALSSLTSHQRFLFSAQEMAHPSSVGP